MFQESQKGDAQVSGLHFLLFFYYYKKILHTHQASRFLLF